MVFAIYLICLLFFKSGFSRNRPFHESFEIRYGPSLEYKWRNNSRHHVGIYNQQLYCCSTLLTLEHTLTTAGCFVPLGEDVTKMLAYGGTTFHYHHDPRAQVRAVKQVIIHEKYSMIGKPDNDIALVVVTPPFVQTYRISPARLPDRLILNSKEYIPVYENSLRIGRGDIGQAGVVGTITMTDYRIMGEGTLICDFCNKEFQVGDKYFDENGTVVEKLICFSGWNRRVYLTNSHETVRMEPCFGGLGCPVMTFDHVIIAMQSISYDQKCNRYTEMPLIYERLSVCTGHDKLRYIQVFHYVDWIRSNIKKKKLIRFRPFRVSSKKINIKPYIPLSVYITLHAIAIMVFLVCNRTVFVRLRF